MGILRLENLLNNNTQSMKSIVALLILFLAIFASCDRIYKAGNSVPLLDLKIETNVNDLIVYRFLDSVNSRMNMDEKYMTKKFGGGLAYFPGTNGVAYFVDSPYEVYHLSSNGLFKLAEVYNPAIKRSDWLTDGQLIGTGDYDRFERRIYDILNKIVLEAKKAHVPDSVIFYKKPYDTVLFKLKRP
jgi:hypothetical protein